MKKPRKIVPYGPTYRRLVTQMALSHFPNYACQKCNYPVHYGYVCEYCGDDNPREASDD